MVRRPLRSRRHRRSADPRRSQAHRQYRPPWPSKNCRCLTGAAHQLALMGICASASLQRSGMGVRGTLGEPICTHSGLICQGGGSSAISEGRLRIAGELEEETDLLEQARKATG